VAVTKLFGSRIKRREDPRLITGKGRFTDNIKLPGLTYAAFIRSPHPRAKIIAIHSGAAKAMPGFVGVFTGKDLVDGGVGLLPCGWLLPDLKCPSHHPIAVDVADFEGQAVAVVIADSQYAARDAAEVVKVDYQVLPAIIDTEGALSPKAPQVHDLAPGNVAFHWTIGDKDKTAAAIQSADKVIRQRFINQRLIANAMEPRSCVAHYQPATEELTLWLTSQNPHVIRLLLGAFVLGIPEHKLRVISGDVGGGFGSKIFLYPEETVASWVSKKLGRPVKWTAERRESYMTDAHGRDHVTEAEMATDASGKITALRVKTTANLGAFLSTFAPLIPTYLYGTLLSGVYAIPNIWCEVTGVFTNTTPVDAYRGAGRPEATYLVERLVDLTAKARGLDPVEFRRKNFIAADKFPYQTPVAFVYDSGNYEGALDRLLQMLDYRRARDEQAKARAQGRLVGIGFSTYIEACGPAPSQVAGALGAQAGLWESSHVRVHPTGKVTVFTGSHSHGQGHETTFAQLAADNLGLPIEDIDIVHGDTALVPFGMGTYGSRSAAVGGTALYMSLEKIKEKGKKIAAHLLEAAETDVVYADGKYHVKGAPDRSKTFQNVALMAYLAHSMPAGLEPGLEATSFYDPANFVFPFGAHAAIVEIDPETGHVKIQRYLAVDDVGRVINPMIVDGMVQGGIVQGVAQALWEGAAYDEHGQLLTGSMMDYALPKADFVPSFEIDRTETPSPVNPLGIKGAGETGTIAASAAMANAVMDALAPMGITHLDMPLTPKTLWQAMQGRKGGAR